MQSAERGYLFTATTDNIEGEKCILLYCDYADLEMKLKIWVVPSKGYCIKKMQNVYKGQVIDEYVTNLREYSPAVWWFDKVFAKNWKSNQKKPEKKINITVESLKLNEPIDREIFTIAGTNIPWGTRIIDQITGINYVYGQTQEYGERVDLALDALEESMKSGLPSMKNEKKQPSLAKQIYLPEVVETNTGEKIKQENDQDNMYQGIVDKSMAKTNLLFVISVSGVALVTLICILGYLKIRSDR